MKIKKWVYLTASIFLLVVTLVILTYSYSQSPIYSEIIELMNNKRNIGQVAAKIICVDSRNKWHKRYELRSLNDINLEIVKIPTIECYEKNNDVKTVNVKFVTISKSNNNLPKELLFYATEVQSNDGIYFLSEEKAKSNYEELSHWSGVLWLVLIASLGVYFSITKIIKSDPPPKYINNT